MITGIAHVNLTVPPGTLDHADAFYEQTMGFTNTPVPALQKGTLAWFDITPKGTPHHLRQQVHIAFGKPTDFTSESSRHPCFRLESPEALLEMQRKIYDHHVKGGVGAPRAADKPGEENSGEKGIEYPQRFFARDYAGNRLEFSL